MIRVPLKLTFHCQGAGLYASEHFVCSGATTKEDNLSKKDTFWWRDSAYARMYVRK